jgi:hypothetical protein
MMLTSLSPTFREFKQLILFDPQRFLGRMTSITSSGGFSLDLWVGNFDLREVHRLRDREVHTRAEYYLKQGRMVVGDVKFETGVSGVSDEEVENLPYFESLVLRTDIPIALKSTEIIPVSTIKVLLTQPPYSPQVLYSKRTDRTRIVGNLGWMRTYNIRGLLPTSYLVKEHYAQKIDSDEEFNPLFPIA